MLEFFEVFTKASKSKIQDTVGNVNYKASAELSMTYTLPDKNTEFIEDVALEGALNYFYKNLPEIIIELSNFAKNTPNGIDELTRIDYLKDEALAICGGQ